MDEHSEAMVLKSQTVRWKFAAKETNNKLDLYEPAKRHPFFSFALSPLQCLPLLGNLAITSAGWPNANHDQKADRVAEICMFSGEEKSGGVLE